MSNDYQKSEIIKLTEKLRLSISKLPRFCDDFFRGISNVTQVKTKLAYALDLNVFFNYLTRHVDVFKEYQDNKIVDIPLEMLDSVDSIDIEKYLEYLNMYSISDDLNDEALIYRTNSSSGKMRKLSCLRSFYNYYYRKRLIKLNPLQFVDMPKIHEHAIIRLEANEVANMLDEIESGENLTDKQKEYHNKNKERDTAIITLLLGTGIRVSELVGLNISDFDFQNSSFAITRKGGNETILYLPEEVTIALLDYLKKVRSFINAAKVEDEDALFLSLQKKRLTVSSIEKLVKKYSKLVVPLKKMSPHKLRSTYGTNLYKETGDIYLVAEVLGHKDINTTKKHYAAIDEDRKKTAAKSTKLRS